MRGERERASVSVPANTGRARAWAGTRRSRLSTSHHGPAAVTHCLEAGSRGPGGHARTSCQTGVQDEHEQACEQPVRTTMFSSTWKVGSTAQGMEGLGRSADVAVQAGCWGAQHSRSSCRLIASLRPVCGWTLISASVRLLMAARSLCCAHISAGRTVI